MFVGKVATVRGATEEEEARGESLVVGAKA
jgi:hypothetical protein